METMQASADFEDERQDVCIDIVEDHVNTASRSEPSRFKHREDATVAAQYSLEAEPDLLQGEAPHPEANSLRDGSVRWADEPPETEVKAHSSICQPPDKENDVERNDNHEQLSRRNRRRRKDRQPRRDKGMAGAEAWFVSERPLPG